MKSIKYLNIKGKKDINLMTHSSCLIDDKFKMKHCKLTEYEKKEIELEWKQEWELEMKKWLTFGTHKSNDDHNESDW